MDNEMKPQIVTGPSIRVCPICGPTVMGFSGRVIPVVCDSCAEFTDRSEKGRKKA